MKIEDLGTLAEERTCIAELLRTGSSKSALGRAKVLHQREQTAVTAQLVADSYLARIDDLLVRGLAKEAEGLLELVAERQGAPPEQLHQRRLALAIQRGEIDPLLRELVQPELGSDDRRRLCETLRRWLTDPQLVAQSDALPPEHPLRREAVTIVKAFGAATAGPVTDEQVALPSVSRRSPFAPWKLLVRAIAALHQHDDEACRRALAPLRQDCPPGRLAPVIRSLAADEPVGHPRAAVHALASNVTAGHGKLRDALEAADQALAAAQGKLQKRDRSPRRAACRAIRTATDYCERSFPNLCERLRQHASVRCMRAGIAKPDTARALRKPAVRNAHFWRLLARAFELEWEQIHQEQCLFEACSLWEEFRRHACGEGTLEAGTAAEAAVYLHMIELHECLPHDELAATCRSHYQRTFDGHQGYYAEGQPPEVLARVPRGKPDTYFLYPERIFARACRAHPDAELYERWLAWADKAYDHWRPAAEVATAWHEALPADVRPLLHLMEAAEQRNALKKALGYLERAEALDELSAPVRRARLRLLVATTKRHLRAGKPHLVEGDLVQLSELHAANEGDGPALLAALRWAAAVLAKDSAAAVQTRDEVTAQLGEDRLAASALLEGVIVAGGLDELQARPLLPPPEALEQPGALGAAAARACALGGSMSLPLGIPAGWCKRILVDLKRGGDALGAEQRCVLAEAALRDANRQLAYAATAGALRDGGTLTARLLLLRARSLPDGQWMWLRRRNCLQICVELARRTGNTALVNEAVGLVRRRRRNGFFSLAETHELLRAPAKQKVQRVILREQEATAYPRLRSYDVTLDLDEDEQDGPCSCPRCRAERGERSSWSEGDPSEFPFDDDDPIPFDDELDPWPPFGQHPSRTRGEHFQGDDGELPLFQDREARRPQAGASRPAETPSRGAPRSPNRTRRAGVPQPGRAPSDEGDDSWDEDDGLDEAALVLEDLDEDSPPAAFEAAAQIMKNVEPGLAGLPTPVLALILEASIKHGVPDNEGLPDPELIEERDPELAMRMHRVLLETMGSAPPRPKPQRRKPRSKKKPRRRR